MTGISKKRNSVLPKGFALIELLVVISIIALLMSILMPALAKAKALTKFIICGSNQRQIVLASVLYASANEDEMPPHMGKKTDKTSGNSHWDHPWQLISCPSNTNIETAVSYGIVFGDVLPSYDVWYCPLSPAKSGDIEYTVSGRTITIVELYEESDLSWVTGDLFVPMGYLPLWGYGGFEDPGVNVKSFVGPKHLSDGNALIFADNVHYADHAGLWRSTHPFDAGTKEDRFYTLFSDDTDPMEVLGKVKYNAGYKDGHVESFTTDETIAQDNGRGCTYHIPKDW